MARQSIGMPWRHDDVQCDGCSTAPILGYRYRSRRRSNYDLCSDCFRQLTPQRAESFDRFERSSSSPPFQIRYAECGGCGQAPIQGLLYAHVMRPNYVLCENCFQQATCSTNGYAQAEPTGLYREVEPGVCTNNNVAISNNKAWNKPVYHFDRQCNDCDASPICGPCFVNRRDDALCALCYDTGIQSERFGATKYRMVPRPEKDCAVNLVILFCQLCGAIPICGPAFRTPDRSQCFCLPCYVNMSPQEQSFYSRLEAPKAWQGNEHQNENATASDDEDSDGCGFEALNLDDEYVGHGGRKKKKDSWTSSAHGQGKGYTAEPLPSQIQDMATDLTKIAAEGKLDPVVGRDKQIDQVIMILGRKSKSNACLIGEPGVGKTAVAEGLAQRIVQGQVPDSLKGKQIVSLDIGRLTAGTTYRGQFEEKVIAVLDASKESGKMILFIDEIHTVVGTGKTDEGGMDAGDLLKPALARGEIQCLGATTLEEYRKYFEKDAALARRFQKVEVLEPTVPEAIEILKGLKKRYETHHNLRYTDEALVAAALLSSKYISDRFLPDKAIDLIDEAGSLASSKCGNRQGNNKNQLLVTETDIQNLVAEKTGIPVAQLSAAESDRLLQMEQILHERVIGQEEAVRAISSAVRRSRVGLQNPNRPIASFIFCGPTGVGKTELAKALAASYFGSEESMVRLDMSEFMEKISLTRLVGVAPGYVGQDDGGQLTEAVRRHPYTLVLLDEVEKAHPDVFNLFLQILDDGRLSDAKGRVVDFRNTLIILTSNVGSSAILQEAGSSTYSILKSVVNQELEKHFRPEFLNRLDEIIVFQKLNKEQVGQIADLQIIQFAARLKEKKIELHVSPRLRHHILNEGFNPTYGARPLKRAITRLLENVVAEKLLTGGIKEGDSAVVDLDASSGAPTVTVGGRFQGTQQHSQQSWQGQHNIYPPETHHLPPHLQHPPPNSWDSQPPPPPAPTWLHPLFQPTVPAWRNSWEAPITPYPPRAPVPDQVDYSSTPANWPPRYDAWS